MVFECEETEFGRVPFSTKQDMVSFDAWPEEKLVSDSGRILVLFAAQISVPSGYTLY